MSRLVKISLSLLAILGFATDALAMPTLCLNTTTGRVIRRRRCPRGALTLTPGTNVDLTSFSSCSSCGTSMAGEWSYSVIDDNNTLSFTDTITFTQSGADFQGSNMRDTIVGRVQGKLVTLTRTVSGEEGLGFVALAQGTLFTVGNVELATLALVNDTFGRSGSIIMRRTLP